MHLVAGYYAVLQYLQRCLMSNIQKGMYAYALSINHDHEHAHFPLIWCAQCPGVCETRLLLYPCLHERSWCLITSCYHSRHKVERISQMRMWRRLSPDAIPNVTVLDDIHSWKACCRSSCLATLLACMTRPMLISWNRCRKCHTNKHQWYWRAAASTDSRRCCSDWATNEETKERNKVGGVAYHFEHFYVAQQEHLHCDSLFTLESV